MKNRPKKISSGPPAPKTEYGFNRSGGQLESWLEIWGNHPRTPVTRDERMRNMEEHVFALQHTSIVTSIIFHLRVIVTRANLMPIV